MEAETSSRPRWLLPMAAVVTIVLLGGLFWLFRPGGENVKAPVDVFKLPKLDGTLVVVEPPKLVLRPFQPYKGRNEVEFTIRDQDKGNFDLAHLRSHSSIGLPTRLYYLEAG